MNWPKFEELPTNFPLENVFPAVSLNGKYAMLSKQDYERARRALAAIEIMERRKWYPFLDDDDVFDFLGDREGRAIEDTMIEADRWLSEHEAKGVTK